MKILFRVLLCLLFIHSSASADEAEILRLKKGEYYYYYLTGDYPNAMNQLHQWRKADVVDNGTNDGIFMADETDVMEATILLSLGLTKPAQQLYEKIQNNGRKVSSQSWFYLAQRWFELDHYEAALYCMDRIHDNEVDSGTLAETQYMRATAYLEIGMRKLAKEQIEQMPRYGIWAGYARHNYILAMFHGNNSGKSLPLLVQEASYFLPKSKEARILKDRMHLMTAIHFLNEGDSKTAAELLQEVGLYSPYSSVALLHYGWSLLHQGRYEEAIQPWRILQTRYVDYSPDVMESLVGVPQVLELMKAETQSLKTFESAEKKLLKMKADITDFYQQIENNSWLEHWISQQNNKDWGWQSDIESTLELSSDNQTLQELVTNNHFIQQLAEYRDLVLLTEYLTEKQHDLTLWLNLVEKRERESNLSEASSALQDADHKIAMAKLGLNNLQNYLDKSYTDLYALPTADESEQLSTLVESSEFIKRLIKENKASRNLEQYKQRWMRVKGVFLWQLNEEKANKQWRLKKELIAINDVIGSAEQQLSETRLASQWTPQSWAGLKQKIVDLLDQSKALKQRALSEKANSKAALSATTDQHLLGLISRVNDYLAQARLSIARLYDDALQKQLRPDSISEPSSLEEKAQ